MKSMDRARSPGHDVPTRAQMFQLLRQHEACIRSWTCTLAEDTGNADRCGHSDTTSISCVSMVQSGGVSRPRESALFCLAFAGTGCWLVVKTVPLRDGTAIEEAPDGAVNMAAIDVPTQISSSPGSRRHMITFASSSARESFTTAVRAALALKSDSTDDCIEADTVTRVRFRAIKKAVLRKGFERDSEVCGALQPGDMVRVEERRDLESTVRLRCERGWTSATGKDGAVLLLEEGNDTYLQATKDATVRAECGRDSAKVGMLAAGSVIEVLERADEIEGDEASAEGKRTRVRYSLGWVSVFGASGTELLMRTDFQSVKSRIKLSPKQRLQWAVAQTIERESVTLDSEPNDEACDDEDEIPTIDDEKPLHFIDPLIETLVVDVMLESERRPVLGHTVDFATDELLADEPNYIDRLGNNVELGTDKQIACPDGWRWVHLWAVEKEVVRACDAEGWSYWKRMSAFDSVLANKGEPKNTGTTFVRRRVHVRVRQNLAWRTAPLSPDDTEAVLALWREQQSDATSELCKQLEKQVLGRATVSESPGRPSGNTTFVQAVNVSEPTQSAELVSPRYQVIECHVELRQEADAESEICGCLQRGDIVTVLDKRGSGSSLRLHCGEKGWVSAYGSGGRALLLQEQSAGEYLRALAPVSVRAEHQWDSATCGTLPQHSVIDVLERKLEGAGEQAIDDESTDERVRMRFSGGWVTLMNAGKTPPTAASRALASLLLALSLPFPLSSICSQCWRQRRRSTVGDRSIWPFRSSY